MNRRNALGLLLLLSLTLLSPLCAAGTRAYLPAGTPDALLLLPAPPSLGSREQEMELKAIKTAISTSGPAELAAAKAEIEQSVFDFAPILGEGFQPVQFPKTEALFKQVEKETKAVTNAGKDHWKRARPYTFDPSLLVDKPEKSFSYPSGHSTRGTVYAFVLAELFPAKRDVLIEAGRAMGWHRIILGVHYPSDVYSGRVLGQAIAREFLKSAEFQKDLAEVKAELVMLK